MLPIASTPQGALPLHSLSMLTPASCVEGGLGFSSFLGLAALSLSPLFAASPGASHFGVVSFTSVRLVLLPGPCCCSVLSDTLKPHGGAAGQPWSWWDTKERKSLILQNIWGFHSVLSQ